jgi:hypothetical protein
MIVLARTYKFCIKIDCYYFPHPHPGLPLKGREKMLNPKSRSFPFKGKVGMGMGHSEVVPSIWTDFPSF